MDITDDELKRIFPRLADESRAEFLPFINAAMDEFEIDMPLRQAAFLAQMGHESGGLTVFAENLNYSAKALMASWPHRFTTIEIANQYARQPEKIANYVYANRMGNGDEESGDGFRYRGHGPIQITGRETHQQCGEALGIDLVNNPELLMEPQQGFRSAAWYWQTHGLNELADAGNFKQITKVINGGYNGLAERQELFATAQEALGI